MILRGIFDIHLNRCAAQQSQVCKTKSDLVELYKEGAESLKSEDILDKNRDGGLEVRSCYIDDGLRWLSPR